MIKFIGNYIKIDTKNTTLLLEIINKRVVKRYYGSKIRDDKDENVFRGFFDESIEFSSSTDDTTYDNTMMSSNGDGANIEFMVKLYTNNNIVSRFIYDSCELVDINEGYTNFPHSYDKKETIKFIYNDVVSGVKLYHYLSTYEDMDVMSSFLELDNTSNELVHINRLMSLQLDFDTSEGTIYTLDGAWTKERFLSKNHVSNTTFKISSVSGASSNVHNPFMMLEIKNQGFYGTNLVYSGNHLELVDMIPVGKMRLLTGLNDYYFDYKLEPNKTFKSPEAIFTFGVDSDSITFNMHRFIKRHIIREDFREMDRPILINNWEATYFDFTKEKLLSLATKAKSLGIELFVLDDGWFSGRKDDHSSLGDWFDNREKTGGLENLSKSLKDLGMKFGLWVEPEMISEDSELFRKHPEYMMRIPNVKPLEKRFQQMLDLTNKEVENYVIEVLSDLFKKVNVDYVKWDCNRYLIDIYSNSNTDLHEYHYRYIKALYNILYTLTTRFPHVLFESCSAGGNRFDLGMMYFFPQAWCSDNTDAFDRLYIQEGTLYAYPQNTMGAHVSITPNHQTEGSVYIDSRFNVAAFGAFGYELDLLKLKKEDLKAIKNQVSFYKKYRDIFQRGDYYRINSVFDSNNFGWISVNKNKTKALATIVIQKFKMNTLKLKFYLKGLNKDYKYKVSVRNQDNLKEAREFVMYGDALMSYGLDFGNLFYQETTRALNSYSFASRLLIIERVK